MQQKGWLVFFSKFLKNTHTFESQITTIELKGPPVQKNQKKLSKFAKWGGGSYFTRQEVWINHVFKLLNLQLLNKTNVTKTKKTMIDRSTYEGSTKLCN